MNETFLLADIGSQELGLVFKHGKLQDVLQPGTRKLYWKGLVPVEVQRIAVAESSEIDVATAQRLRQIEHAGLLFVDGKLARVLSPGAASFWNLQKNVVAEVIDLRVQAVEVSGQELLTRDKVSLRVNLGASVRVTDPVAARTKVAKYADFLYRELQFGLRQAVSSKSLDELLGDKASLDADISLAWRRWGWRCWASASRT